MTCGALGVRAAWNADVDARLRAVAGAGYDDSVLEFRENLGTDRGERPLTRVFPGPVNPRALLGRCAASDRDLLEQELAAVRAGFGVTSRWLWGSTGVPAPNWSSNARRAIAGSNSSACSCAVIANTAVTGDMYGNEGVGAQ